MSSALRRASEGGTEVKEGVVNLDLLSPVGQKVQDPQD